MRGRVVLLLVLALALVPGGALAQAPKGAPDGIRARTAGHAGQSSPLVGRCLLFDDLTAGSVLTLYRGVQFANSDGPLRVSADYPGPPFTAPNSILPDNYSAAGNHTLAKPPLLVRGAGLTMGDYDSDQDTIYLVAYDTSGGVVGSDSAVLPASLNGGASLSVLSSTANIAYIDFWGVGVNNNSVFFDNVCFGR